MATMKGAGTTAQERKRRGVGACGGNDSLTRATGGEAPYIRHGIHIYIYGILYLSLTPHGHRHLGPSRWIHAGPVEGEVTGVNTALVTSPSPTAIRNTGPCTIAHIVSAGADL